MSIRLMSLVWDITWPTQSQLLVALKLADHAADDGSNVYPAKSTVARQAQCSESTVQNALRAFRECGLLTVIRQGGNGPKDPTVYAINVHLLTQLAEANTILKGGSDRIIIPESMPVDNDEIKGSTVDPLLSTRGQSEGVKGSTDPAKGSKALTPNHHLEPSREPSRAKCENFGSEVKKLEPQFTITPADPQWPNWIEFLRSKNPDDATAAETAGQIVTTAKWASNGRVLHIPRSGLTERSKAMQGETA